MDLQYEVLVTEPIRQNVSERVPNGDVRTWSPMSTTIIYGENEAILVDPQFTYDQGREVASWAASFGRKITHIYVTHGHGDHWLAAPIVQSVHRDAKLVATRGTAQRMREQLSVPIREGVWEKLFPGQIPLDQHAPEIVSGPLFLDEHELLPVEVGHADSDDSTVLWVPSIRLAVAGDVVYNGVHQFLGEAREGGRDAWRRALRIVKDLQPRNVVSGHKAAGAADDAADIDRTREYLDQVDHLLRSGKSRKELFEAMLQLYPDHLNPGALWGGSAALFER